jgi:hypothetical protein
MHVINWMMMKKAIAYSSLLLRILTLLSLALPILRFQGSHRATLMAKDNNLYSYVVEEAIDMARR